MISPHLQPLPSVLASPQFDDLDRHFARFIARFARETTANRQANNQAEWLQCAAAMLSLAIRQGHICLHLSETPAEWSANAGGDLADWPSAAEWQELLSPCPAVTVAPPSSLHSRPETPLILDHTGRLYLARYYAYEAEVAQALLNRVSVATTPRAFPEGQEAALQAALKQSFLVISGGPGTGKTTTLVKILTRYLTENDNLRIALAAPTGKAAARMEEAIREELGKNEALRPLAERFPKARTLDGLLGTRPMRAHPFHHAGNTLPVDLLVVDEASMIALPLMAKLFAALPADARILLLGDRDQLASVAPGSVLGDIAEAASDTRSPMAGSLAMLRENYRFGNESTIYRLSELVRSGDAAGVEALLAEGPREDFSFQALPATPAALATQLRPLIEREYRPFLEAATPQEALDAFSRFRLLAAVRQGPYGVEGLNRLAETILRDAGLLPAQRGLFYHGMPLLITRNDASMNLRNGDIGIILPDPDAPPAADGTPKPLWAWFPAEAGPRRIAPSRLPEFEPAFAMTIHKSQGSEFQKIAMLLPERDLPILTRELIYTGITRARKHVELWASAALLAIGITRHIDRRSGLKERLREGAGGGA